MAADSKGGAGSPVATILRWYTAAPDGAGDKTEGQVLVVTQLRPGATCHIAYIDALANKNANEMARHIADQQAGSFDCNTIRRSSSVHRLRPRIGQVRAICLRSVVRSRADTPISSAMRQTMLSSSSWFLPSANTTCHIMRMISIRSFSVSGVRAEVKR